MMLYPSLNDLSKTFDTVDSLLLQRLQVTFVSVCNVYVQDIMFIGNHPFSGIVVSINEAGVTLLASMKHKGDDAVSDWLIHTYTAVIQHFYEGYIILSHVVKNVQ